MGVFGNTEALNLYPIAVKAIYTEKSFPARNHNYRLSCRAYKHFESMKVYQFQP